jgi:chromosome segregation ATPase
LDGGLLAVFIVVAGTIANFVYSFSRERKARVNIKAITDESAATVRAANLEAEARAEQQRIQYSDFFFKQTQILESKLEKVSSESATKYEQLSAEYTRTVTSNAHMQGQIDHMRIEQVESGKRSQIRDQQLGEYKAQIDQANKQILLQSQRLSELEAELTKTRASEASAIATAEGYRQELNRAQESIGELRAQIEALQAQVNELTEEVSRLRTELNIVKAERDKLHDELQAAYARLDALKTPPNAPAIDFDLGKTQKVDTQGITGVFTESLNATTGEAIERTL